MRNDFFYYHADRYIAKDPSPFGTSGQLFFFPLKDIKVLFSSFFPPIFQNVEIE